MKPAAQSFLRFPFNLVFDSPANVRVLRALSQHGGALSASALVSMSALTKPSVLSALKQLDAAGVIESLGADRHRLYRFSAAGQFGGAIASLFAAERQAFHDLIARLRAAAVGAGAAAAWIYGSVARSEDRPGSDIDVAITCARGGSRRAAAKMQEALTDMKRDLGCQVSIIGLDPRDIERLERERDPWWVEMKRGAMVVMGQAPDGYRGGPSARLRRAQ